VTSHSAFDDRAPRRPALPILTSLRFFAAAEVVIFHISVNRQTPIPPGLLLDLASGGYAAVTFFFGATEQPGPDLGARRFWRMRFARLAPAYYLSLLLALPILVEYVSIHRPALEAFVGPALVLVFLQAWWAPVAPIWNFPAWSLSVECLFYALFPWLARVSARWSRTTLFVVCYVLIVAATIYRADFLALRGGIPDGRPDLYFQGYFPLPYLPLFVFGMALGRQYMFGRRLSSRTHTAMLWLGIGLIVLVFAGRSVLPWWTHSDAILVPAFALLIFGGAGATSGAPILASAPMVLLGESSYAMYILHIPIRLWLEIFLAAARIELSPGAFVLLYFMTVIVISALVFRHVETPLRQWITRTALHTR
jgi:peptidoglycan/LPS O-acetylase OafA/YrhL